MKYTPREPQRLIEAHMLSTPKCAAWANMGSGKTVATLSVIDKRLKTVDVRKVLVLAPLRVAVNTWPAEIEKWDDFRHLTYKVIRGNPAARMHQLRGKEDIHIINFDNLVWLVEFAIEYKFWPYDMVVLDEASQMRNVSAKKVKAFRRVLQYLDYLVELSGTPAPNGLANLWTQIYFLDRGERLYNTVGKYRSRWFDRNENNRYIPRGHAMREITDKVKDLCVTVDARDYIDIKDPIIEHVPAYIDDDTRAQYNQLEDEMFLEFENGESVEVFNPGVLTNKCRQYLNGFMYFEDKTWQAVHDAKLDALGSIIDEANGMPLFVLYQYTVDCDRILAKYPGAEKMGTDPEQLERWNRGEIEMLVAHPGSAGHGLNLQLGSNITVWFGLTWDLEHWEQANERLGPMRQHQAGLDRPSYVYHIGVPDTIDDTMMLRLTTKGSIQDAIKNAAKRRSNRDATDPG